MDEQRQKNREHGFYQGILAALAVVQSAGADTLYDEILNTIDIDALVASTEADDMEWSGLQAALARLESR